MIIPYSYAERQELVGDKFFKLSLLTTKLNSEPINYRLLVLLTCEVSCSHTTSNTISNNTSIK